MDNAFFIVTLYRNKDSTSKAQQQRLHHPFNSHTKELVKSHVVTYIFLSESIIVVLVIDTFHDIFSPYGTQMVHFSYRHHFHFD